MKFTEERMLLIDHEARNGLLVYRGIRERRADQPFASDPGDFGRGVYYTTSLSRAKAYSKTVESKTIRFDNPLLLLVEQAYQLADSYQTVRLPDDWRGECLKRFPTLKDHYRGTREAGCRCQEERALALLQNAERMTRDMLGRGIDGLLSVNEMLDEVEVVDYRPYKK